MTDSSLPPKWRSILDGEQRERALTTASDIAAALERATQHETDGAGMELAEQALLNAYLGFAGRGERHFDAAADLLERAIEQVAQTPMRATLYGGFVGVAWVLNHLQEHELSSVEPSASEVEDPNAQVDDVLGEYLRRDPWNDSFDLISGLVGLGIYFADRLPRPQAKAGLEHVVAHLGKLARPLGPGVAWWTSAEQLLPAARQESPDGHANLGVAHGAPGAVALLAEACSRGARPEEARCLLGASLAWLRSQKSTDPSQESYFAYHYAPGKPWRAARAAWCYGDPGIAAALLCAARWMNDVALEREAIEIGLRAAQRALDRCGVVDAGLCHGAAGLGHLYNRMFQATGDERFFAASLAWLERALRMKREGEGVGGYSSWRPAAGGWTSDRSLLSGATGVALALLAAASNVEPRWDRLLLASPGTTLSPR